MPKSKCRFCWAEGRACGSTDKARTAVCYRRQCKLLLDMVKRLKAQAAAPAPAAGDSGPLAWLEDPEQWTLLRQVWATGKPKGQPRARAFFNAKLGQARVYDAGTAEGWKSAVAEGFRSLLLGPDGSPLTDTIFPLTGAVRVDLAFYFPRPQNLCRKRDPDGPLPYIKKPDRDNSDKAVLDALTSLGIFKDDAIVFAGKIIKVYHAKGASAGAEIMMYQWKDPNQEEQDGQEQGSAG